MKSITRIATVAFLGVIVMNLAIAHAASEITGTLSTSIGTTNSGTIAGTVIGGTSASSNTTSGNTTSGGGSNNTGLGFGGYGGGGGLAYATYPDAPYAGQDIYYQTYTPVAVTDNQSLNEFISSTESSGSESGLAFSSYPEVPYAGGTGGNTSLVAAAASVGGLSTAAAIALVLIGAGAIGGAAYGLNSVYKGRRGL